MHFKRHLPNVSDHLGQIVGSTSLPAFSEDCTQVGDGGQTIDATKLSRSQLTALDPSWFCHGQRNERISLAIDAGFLLVWFNNIAGCFAANEDTGRPTSFPELARALGMNAKHIARYNPMSTSGPGLIRPRQQMPSTILRQRFAFELGIPERDLSPSEPDWIASSALCLVTMHAKSHCCSVTHSDFLPLGHFLFSCILQRAPLSRMQPVTIAAIEEQIGVAIGRAQIIQRVLVASETIGTVLIKTADGAVPRRSSNEHEINAEQPCRAMLQ